MNILIINWQCIKNPLSGGAEVHLHEIFSRIVKMGHNVTLLCSAFTDSLEIEYIDGIRIIRLGKRNVFNFIVRKFYKNITSKEHFDIVIDDINKIPFYIPCFVKEPILAISHHFFGKSIFKETNCFVGTYVILSEWLMKFVYKTTQFVVVSQSTKDDCIKRKIGQDISIIYNGLDTKKFPLQVEIKEQNPTITYFGRLKKYKSVDHLFYAFKNIKEKYPNSILKIIGKGDFREYLEKLAERLNIKNNVKFLGFVSEEVKIKELTNSYVVVNTSLKEGWGITNIEANACGTPVISANVPGLKDSVSNGKSGLLYDYGNIKQLTEYILKIIDDSKYRAKLSNGAIEWAKKFSWDNSAEQMLNKCIYVIEKYKNNT